MKKIILIGRCVFYRFFILLTRRVAHPPRVFVVVQPAKLGDMVCTTPVFRALKNKYPQAQVVVVGAALNRSLLAGNSDVDAYIDYTRDISTLIKQIRSLRPDFGCVATPDFRSLATLILAGVRTIVVPRIENGHSPSETIGFRFLRWLVVAVPHRMGHYAPREYLRLLEPAGIFSQDTAKHLAYTAEAHQKVSDYLAQAGIGEGEKLIGIAPAAGNRIKMWPAERFAAVANELATRHHLPIIIIGGPQEHEDAQRMMASLLPTTKFLDTTGIFDIQELKALVPKLSLFISVDTGPIYIAEAFGVPTVDITGPIDENEQPPIGLKHLVVTPPEPRLPQLFVMRAHPQDEREARRQAESITVEMVLAAAQSLLG